MLVMLLELGPLYSVFEAVAMIWGICTCVVEFGEEVFECPLFSNSIGEC